MTIHLKCFHTLYFLAKQEIPTDKFLPFIDHMENIGLDKLRHFNHRSTPSVREMLRVIGETVGKVKLTEIQKCTSFGILVDEVTDISVIVFAKYVTDSGNPSTVFVACQALMDGANALAIVAKIEKALEEAGLDIKCVTTFVSDGASVMIGKTNGVAVKLREKYNQCLISIHCICHRLALACVDTSKDVSLASIKDVEDLLYTLWRALSNSPKRTAVFIKVQLEMKALSLSAKAQGVLSKRIRRACRTRWLSIDQGVASCLDNYAVALHTLESLQDSDALAMGLLKKMKSVLFLGTLYILSAVLPILSELSRVFQTGALNFSHIDSSVQRTLGKLAMIEDPVSLLEKDLTGRFIMLDLTLVNANKQILKDRFRKYIESLKKNISKRFDNCNILENFYVLNPLTIPDPKWPEFQQHGRREIGNLADHFYPNKADQKEELLNEWGAFKFILHKMKGKVNDEQKIAKCTPLERAMILFFQHKNEFQYFYPHMLHLIEIILSAPVTNAWPERGASAIKRIKTRFRSRIQQDLLNALLHISMNGPPVGSSDAESLISKALQAWNDKKNRRKMSKAPSSIAARSSASRTQDACCQTDHAEVVAHVDVLTDDIVREEVRDAQTMFNLHFSGDLSSDSEYDLCDSDD